MASGPRTIQCPRCGHINIPAHHRSLQLCEKCGYDLEILRFNQKARKSKKRQEEQEMTGRQKFFARLTRSQRDEGQGMFYLRVLLFAGMVVWGMHFMKMGYGVDHRGMTQVNGSVMHLINLPVHEAGHVIFRPFGEFITALGGSLMQLLLPFGIMLRFVLKTRDNFAGALGLWWVAQSLKDVVPYINDARALKMMLLTGPAALVPETHDWRYLLGRMGLLEYDTAIAAGANFFSGILFLLAFFWAGAVLYDYWKAPREEKGPKTFS
jgi:ribosomal protein L37E